MANAWEPGSGTRSDGSSGSDWNPDTVQDPTVPAVEPDNGTPGLVDPGGVTPPSEATTPPEVAAGNTFITPEATVAGQLETILAEGSPLQDLAEARSKAKAQQSGLLSSSMAVGAGQQALYDSALKVATPDAATYAKAGLTEQQAVNQLGQTGYEGDISSQLVTQKGDIEKDIQAKKIIADKATQERAIGHEENTQEKQIAADNAMEVLRQDEHMSRLLIETASAEGINQADIEASMAEMVYTLGIEDANVDAQLLADIVANNAALDQADREAFQTNVQTVWANYNRDVQEIQTNADMTADEKSSALEQNFYAVRDQIDFMASVSGQDINWDLYGDYGDTGGSDVVDGDGDGIDDNTGDPIPDEPILHPWLDPIPTTVADTVNNAGSEPGSLSHNAGDDPYSDPDLWDNGA